MVKKYKIVLLVLLFFLLTGCKDYGEKRIVKLITIDKEKITLYYYDYTADNPSFLSESTPNTGIENSIIELLSHDEYNLKLCEYAVCDEYIVENNISELFYGLINSKFSPNIKIIKADLSDNNEEYINLKKDNYPIYSYYINDNGINAVIENADSDEKNIIIDNSYYKKISVEEGFLLDILMAGINEGFYNFQSGSKKYSAELENINVVCSNKNNTTHININAVLKSYKGLSSEKKEKLLMTDIIKNSFEENLENILSDQIMTKNLNLLWYKKLYNNESVKIIVNIK